MTFTTQDEQFMLHVLELARKGTARTSPGARVGAVVVDGKGEIAGSGFYIYDGVKHAEVLALEQAGPRARGGTLYLNLEPCSHHGRTPPCADTVVAAGIRRVVAAMADPNPLVSGKGFAKLRAAGTQVETGLLESEARRLNESFARYILDRRPLVTLKSAMTLDGKIAGGSANAGSSSRSTTWITGEQARAHVHELRHETDAILVGVGTVLADDPLLTDRTGRPRRRPLLRVVLDSNLRLPSDSRLVKTAAGDLLVFCASADERRKRELQHSGVHVEAVSSGPNGRPDLPHVIQRLGELEIASLLIEGGAHVNGAVLQSGLVDKIFLYYAPKIMASPAAVSFVCVPDMGANGIAVSDISLHRFGQDFAVEGYLRDPYKPASIHSRNAIASEERV